MNEGDLRAAATGDRSSKPPQGLIFVPFLPDGRLALIREPSGGLALPKGKVLPGEDLLLDAALRIPLMTAGFRMQHFHAFGTRDSWVTAWIEGDIYGGQRPHVKADLVVAYPAEAARLLRASGRADLASLVEEASESLSSITEDEYLKESTQLLEGAYLRATTPEGGSGFGGTPEQWRLGREHIVDGINRSGTFLDTGCANGLLMESVARWASERALTVEPYGIDVGTRLVQLAKDRLPQWRDRIWVGNALDWTHHDDMRFDFVHMLLDFVRPVRREQLIRHLLEHVVAPGGRLLVSHYIDPEVSADLSAEQILKRLGFEVAGVTSPKTTGKSPSAWIECPLAE